MSASSAYLKKHQLLNKTKPITFQHRLLSTQLFPSIALWKLQRYTEDVSTITVPPMTLWGRFPLTSSYSPAGPVHQNLSFTAGL